MFAKKPCLLFFLLFVQSYVQCDGWTTSPFTLDSATASSAAPLVVDVDGNVTSAWLENYSGGDDPQAAFFSNTLQQWMSPQNIAVASAGVSMPQLIVDAFGTVTMVWVEYYNQNNNAYTLFASRSTKGGPWTTPVPLNTDSMINVQGPVSMVVDAQGNVTLAWLAHNAGTSNYGIGTAHFTANIATPPTLYPLLDGVSPHANGSVIPQLVVDQLGYVTAVWQELIGSTYGVQAARLDPAGSAWSAATTLDTPHALNTITPQMVVDASGIVTVVWQEITGPTFTVQAARFVPGVGGAGGSWTTYTTIAPALANAHGSLAPQLIVDAQGSVTAVAVDASLSVWPASFAANASAWTSPGSPLNTGTAFSLTPLSLVADATGIVTIGWVNNAGGQLFIQAARGFSTTWGTAATLDTGNANGSTPVLMVIDASGIVTVSWIEGTSMQAARFVSPAWTSAVTLDGGNLYNLVSPKIVCGPSGAVTVVWQEGPDGGGKYAVQAAHFSPEANAWGSATTLDNGVQVPNAYWSSMTQQLNMVVDLFDNVTAVWLETVDAGVVVQSARFSLQPAVTSLNPNQGPTTGGTSVTITGTHFNAVTNVLFGTQPASSFIVVDSSHITAISPSASVGTVDVTVVTTAGTSPVSGNDQFTYLQAPPASISGKQIENKFLMQADIVNIIQWTAPASGAKPVAYKIYRDTLDTLIGTVVASAPLIFEDHNRVQGVVYTYYVRSVDSNGNLSTPVSISIAPGS